MIDLEKILELEAKATPGPWIDSPGMGEIFPSRFGSIKTNHWFGTCAKTPYSTYSDGFCDTYVQDENSQFIVEMRNNIRQICLELRAAREYFSRDKEAEDMYDTGDMMGAGNAWRDCEDLLEKYYEVTNEKY